MGDKKSEIVHRKGYREVSSFDIGRPVGATSELRVDPGGEGNSDNMDIVLCVVRAEEQSTD